MLNPPPPRDSNDKVVPHDHEEIKDVDFLIRGIASSQIVNGRISSGAFNSSTQNDPYFGLSVDLEKVAARNIGEHYVGSVKFTASVPREKSLLVGYDPIIDKNEAHCSIWRVSEKGSTRLSKGHSRHIHKNASWHVEIPGIKICK